MQIETKNPWMMSFSRTGLLRFISHLDWLAMVERILIRAETPVVYSEGYHPRPIMKTSPPLPTGVASLCELLQIFLREQRDPKEVARRIADALPEDIGLNWVQQMRFKPPKNPYKAIVAAEYRYEFNESLPYEKRQRLLSILSSLIPNPDKEGGPPLGPDPTTLKPIAGRLIEINGDDTYLEGESNHLQLVGRLDSNATLHAGKLGFFLYEMVPLARYPLIIKFTHLRHTDKGYEAVFER